MHDFIGYTEAWKPDPKLYGTVFIHLKLSKMDIVI